MTVKIDASTSADVHTALPREGRLVLSFLGYSAAGYEDKPAMIAIASAILDEYPVATTIVNIGASAGECETHWPPKMLSITKPNPITEHSSTLPGRQ